MKLGDLPDRNAEIAQRYLARREPLGVIGRDYGISGERVRQIARRAGLSRQRMTRPPAVIVARACPKCGVRWSAPVSNRKRFCSISCAQKKYTRQSLLSAYMALASRLGVTPGIHDLNARDSGTPCHMVYVREFGSMSATALAAGLQPNRVGAAGWRARRSSIEEGGRAA